MNIIMKVSDGKPINNSKDLTKYGVILMAWVNL